MTAAPICCNRCSSRGVIQIARKTWRCEACGKKMSVRTKPAPDPEKNGFIQGVAYAAAFLIRYHDRPTVALELLKEAGFSKADLLKARVDEYDLEPIKTAAHGERGVKHAWKWR